MKIRHIHLVDDDQVFCFLAKKILQQSNLNADIQISLNGKAAFEYLEAALNLPDLMLPDIILLDINMPVMNGWDFLDEFRKNATLRDHVKVLVLSSSVDPGDKEKALSYKEVTGYIEKPLTTGFFDELNQRYLDR
jgi:CheY-like chemotaxis protein